MDYNILIEAFKEEHVDAAKFLGKDITVKTILENHWYDFVDYADTNNILIRDSVHQNVEKALLCGTEDLGIALIVCPKCGELDYICASCKGRLCSSCGTKYAKQRAVAIAEKLTDNVHRHAVFTIPEELRSYFYNNYDLINVLFRAVADTILEYTRKRNKSKEYTPGFVCVLHTYGRDLKFNPHIHILLSEAFLTNDGSFVKNDYFDFKAIPRIYRTKLLMYMSEEINTKEFTNLSFKLTKKYKEEGFYVYMPKNPLLQKEKHRNKKRIQESVNYVVRYVGKPAIANSRIIDYDQDDQMVSFIYQQHEDDEWVKMTMHVFEFINRLIAHVPDKNFKTTRYYGYYSPNNNLKKEFEDSYQLLYDKEHMTFLKNVVYKYAYMLMYYFDEWGPRNCRICGTPMEFVYAHYHDDRQCVSYTFHPYYKNMALEDYIL